IFAAPSPLSCQDTLVLVFAAVAIPVLGESSGIDPITENGDTLYGLWRAATVPDGVAIKTVTGGASLMPGLDQVATERFRLPVRVGKPEGVSGLVDVVASPAHATAVGLVRYGMLHGRDPASAIARRDGAGRGGFTRRLRDLLKDFF
ncbi:MAG: hypothetical protein P1P87_12815, partial [Trueperaceae bacterium]|nr:hypothetical protein [Trueperaceae bacterium]